MRRIIFVGTIGCGKTTLGQAMLGQDLHYKKTQSVEILGNCILDTPGEYLELVKLRGALMMTAVEANTIVLLQSATEPRNMYSPAYAGAFAKEVIGVVTKIDLATEEQIRAAEHALEIAGARKIFRVSSTEGTGVQELMDYLNTEGGPDDE